MPGNTRRPNQRPRKPAAPTSWDALAHWYDGWVGEGGSEYHREVAVPALLRLLNPQVGESILDIGAGQGVPAAAVARAGAKYVGVDASPRLIEMARKRHGRDGTFIVGDARKLPQLSELRGQTFDAVLFLLSLQDMDPLGPVLAAAASMLRPQGRAILMLTHPAFRVPRQSGWGWDEGRKLLYRRVDRYLTPLPVPMKALPGRDPTNTTRSFHRPIEAYVNGLADSGLLTERLQEIPAHKMTAVTPNPRATTTARKEIPLFLGLRARKVGPGQ
jgi:ubiquinone/menaquinone biosynthesis C-methylase UbiE